MTANLFVPPAAEGLPQGALDSATEGADRLDAAALTPTGRNFLAHALVQLARDGWLRSEPGEGFEAVRERPTAEPQPPAVVSSPPATDRATVLREAADDLATAFGDPTAKHIGILAASYLRRRARETEVAPTIEAQPEAEPEMPLEKRLRFSERRNDELRTECLRRGKTVAERGEKIRALEKQLDEVRSQLGAEILRAGQAEAELCRMADEAQQSEGECPQCGDAGACAGGPCPLLPAVGAQQPDTETQDACTCASAGDAFVPAGHYRDCPAAALDRLIKSGRLKHFGGNAEDCPACHGTNPPYPFICPGPDGSPS